MTYGASVRGAFGCVLLLLSATSCANVLAPPADDCIPEFPYTGGWLGGDAAYSVPLADGRSVWLFGDTFIGASDQRTRTNSKLIHNSIAVSECNDAGHWSIDYAWGTADDGAAKAFVPGESKTRYWWLFDGFEFANNFYIGLLGVETSEARGDLNLSFRNTEMKLARISNYHEPPDHWEYEILPLSTHRAAFPGSAMVIHDDYLYMFAFVDLDANHRPRMLARLPLSSLETGLQDESFEFLARGNVWRPGFEPALAAIVMNDNATEMSVRFDSRLAKWIAVYQRLDEGKIANILLRTATELEGPWSEPVIAVRPAELALQIDPNTFCYAAKEHPQFATAEALVITYVCNLLTPAGADPWIALRRLGERMDLYRPQVVKVPLSILGQAPRKGKNSSSPQYDSP